MADLTGSVHHLNLSVSNLDRSAAWYQQLFDLTELTRIAADDGSSSKIILRHPTGLLVGLTQHHANDGLPFDEQRCGFDHVALVVPDQQSLREWEDRLDEHGVPHSPIKASPLGTLITLRDPDNIQLELYTPQP